MRWPTVDAERHGQTNLFALEGTDSTDGAVGLVGLVGPERGTGRLSGLEFLPVTARRILNRVGPRSPMPFSWTINAYRGCSHACTYCFARPTHEYLGLDAGSDFDHRIVVKINAVERLRAELAAPGWQRDHVAMGTNTDPYQRAEGKYRLTRGIIGELARARTPFSILTKSSLVARDIDVLTEAAAQVDVTVHFSIGTVDEAVWRASEPGTPHPRSRLNAMRELAEAGVRTGALIAPVLPGLSDRREQLRDTVQAVLEHGGRVIGSRPLYLRGATRDVFLDWLSRENPQLYQRYLAAFAGRTELRRDYADWVRAAIAGAIEEFGR